MLKRLITPADTVPASASHSWLDLQALADVEVTSEQPAAPVETALLPGGHPGWRASDPGQQSVRLCFSAPQDIERIQLVFVEETTERVQEFVLRWLPAGQTAYREIVRQQYGFSPPGTTEEREDYTVGLKAVAALELVIVPDIRGGAAFASLRELRLA